MGPNTSGNDMWAPIPNAKEQRDFPSYSFYLASLSTGMSRNPHGKTYVALLAAWPVFYHSTIDPITSVTTLQACFYLLIVNLLLVPVKVRPAKRAMAVTYLRSCGQMWRAVGSGVLR